LQFANIENDELRYSPPSKCCGFYWQLPITRILDDRDEPFRSERVQSQKSYKLTDYDPTPSLWRKYFHNKNRKNLQYNRFLLSYVEMGRRMRMECQAESGAK